ncbi:MAG: hypothetical protein HC810_00075 [Acaryochloridaceae cyanobacterium RL_2_7]|nr:hypothetical protein [Acaryochloridaceae cyanobacterium RL_2_7]
MIDSSVPRRRDIELRLGQGEAEFLASLETWRSLGLMTEYELQEFCSTSLSCPLKFSLPTRWDSPNLLVGLDLWLSQGVLADGDVLAWCAEHLSSPLPEVLAPILVDPTPVPSQARPKFGGVPTLLQALMDEISVLWLLFLGVFLVVVSSGVLAASQWNSVPPAGQYGILWSYTFVFWGVSHWLGRRENLQLTAQTLQLTALLIIPVNFWMIDSFKLVQGGLSLGVALVAGVVLSGLMAYTLRPRDSDRWGKGGWFVFINLLLLSWLHWGWKNPWVPPVAIYVGIVLTGICTILSGGVGLDQVRARPPNRYSFVALLGFTPLYGMLLLLFRGLWIEQLDSAPLSLAFGLVGGIFCGTARRQSFGARAWWLAGFSFLIYGRLDAPGIWVPWAGGVDYGDRALFFVGSVCRLLEVLACVGDFCDGLSRASAALYAGS